MKTVSLKLSTKLYAGFSTIVVLFAAISLYMVFNFNQLKELENISEGRAKDAVAIENTALQVAEVYPVIADGIINRDLAETREDFSRIKERKSRILYLQI